MLFKIVLLVIFTLYIVLVTTLVSRPFLRRRQRKPARSVHSQFDAFPGDALLELVDVHKSFDSNPVLEGISLKICVGETLGILGQSGSGKTVLLKLAVGLLRPERGQILFKGKDITQMEESGLLEVRKRLSYVFQGSAFFDFLTAKENIAYPLREKGIDDEETIRQRVEYLLDAVEMTGMGDLDYTELSLGSKKQVAIARAIANNPEAILYDEPTTGVDPILGKSISRLIRKLNQQEHLTSVVVTHDLKCIEMVSDRIILLKDGHVHFEGGRQQFQSSQDSYVKAFIAGRRFEEPKKGIASLDSQVASFQR